MSDTICAVVTVQHTGTAVYSIWYVDDARYVAQGAEETGIAFDAPGTPVLTQDMASGITSGIYITDTTYVPTGALSSSEMFAVIDNEVVWVSGVTGTSGILLRSRGMLDSTQTTHYAGTPWRGVNKCIINVESGAAIGTKYVTSASTSQVLTVTVSCAAGVSGAIAIRSD
jgi:hypothetical protein